MSGNLKKVIWHREGILNLVSHLIWLTRREYRFYNNKELDKLNFPWPWTKSYLRFLYKVPSLRNVFGCDVYVIPFFIWCRHLTFDIIVIIDSIAKIPNNWSQKYEIPVFFPFTNYKKLYTISCSEFNSKFWNCNFSWTVKCLFIMTFYILFLRWHVFCFWATKTIYAFSRKCVILKIDSSSINMRIVMPFI